MSLIFFFIWFINFCYIYFFNIDTSKINSSISFLISWLTKTISNFCPSTSSGSIPSQLVLCMRPSFLSLSSTTYNLAPTNSESGRSPILILYILSSRLSSFIPPVSCCPEGVFGVLFISPLFLASVKLSFGEYINFSTSISYVSSFYVYLL